MRYEAVMIDRYLTKNPAAVLHVRMHPSWDIRTEIEKLLSSDVQKRTLFDNFTRLFQQFLKMDVVITTNYSTVFLDAAFAKLPVLRVHSPITFPDKLPFDSELIRDVFDVNGMEKELDHIFKNPVEAKDDVIGSLLYLNDDVWHEILA